MIDKIKETFFSTLVGLGIVFSSATFLYLNPPIIEKARHFLDNRFYDLKLRYAYRPIDPQTPITIIDIDDRSLQEEGRWPWPRRKIAQLIERLYAANATVVALDILFSEPQENDAQQVIDTLQEEGKTAPEELVELRPLFDEDLLLSEALKKGETIGAFTLQKKIIEQGMLPQPLATESLSFLSKYSGYISNISEIAQSLKNAGSINSTPDLDGVIRYAPMLLNYKQGIYPSLSLAATLCYLQENHPTLVTEHYSGGLGLEGVKTSNAVIPMTAFGKMLIPFRGPPHSFPYVSAADVLQGKAPKELLSHRLLFIGSSATGLGDLFPTAIAPVFAGVEIHASLAAGILNNYFPYNPTWNNGVAIALILILGLLAAIAFPHLGPVTKSLLFFSLASLLLFWDFYMWKKQAVVVSVLSPILVLFALYLFNTLYDYFFEVKKEERIRGMFGQYISPDYLEIMLKSGQDYELKGENKELSVLFADIFNFTTHSEKFSAPELKNFLNEFFTPMTQEIFDHHGTIDKYVGDMVMAFWGAPLEDTDHATHAVDTALAMQEKLQGLNALFKERNYPEITIGIGVNTGMMNVGDMGSKFRRAYTVLGDSVNLAARLESLTRVYNLPILVGKATKEAAPHYCYKTIDKVQVKGKDEAVLIYQPMLQQDATFATHEEAMQAYFNKDWEKADTLFTQLEPSHPDLYKLYKERVAQFRANPPPDNWNGAYIFQKK